ncbi:MAG: hypothetical protein AB7L13_14520 [Acidimicrobiia bacterium]
MSDMVATWQWWEHFTGNDAALLSRAAAAAGVDPDRVRADHEILAEVLSHEAMVEVLWSEGDPLMAGSPFLVFATAVHRGWAELQGVNHVAEWVGARQRLPVLGGDDLRGFLASDQRRFFLASLLASYTKVTSGATWVQSGRKWRKHKFSELDPIRLTEMLEVVPAEDRAGIYRRLGDLALFLSGVFPDNTELFGLGPVAAGRLMRASGLTVDPYHENVPGPVELLERLGARWYQQAYRTASAIMPGSTSMAVVADVADQFVVARRVLNVVTDKYLFPLRGQWFGNPAA